MEAIPRLPMLSFELKHSPEVTSFSKLKRYIAECYHEDPETYSKEIYALETLRNTAMRPALDVSGCSVLKRYYAQLHSLLNRFPMLSEKEVLNFSWSDVHTDMISRSSDIKNEMASILYNIGCLHTVLGSIDARTTNDGMKLSCTHFQCAAWAFKTLNDSYATNLNNSDMSPDILLFMEQLCLAQAQECILEKSLADNRKSGIVAKVTSQIISYYNAALASLMSCTKEGRLAEFTENKTFKKWKRYVKFKILYLSSILLLYQGQQSEEAQKMGERVTLFQAAWDKLEESKKDAKNMFGLDQVNEALIFLTDIVEAKRKNAKNENEFIYHEEVPNISTISAMKGANLVNGIGFNVNDADVLGDDIFSRLVPMKAHEASSLYSEEKATFLRCISSRVEERNIELNTFMSSLNTEQVNEFESIQNWKFPQEVVDRCAAINAKPNAIPDLIQSMSNLADICVDVETTLNEIKELLKDEEIHEKNYQKKTGGRASVHFGELNREFQKYQEAHSKAGESNDTLRKAMGLHVTNLKILSQPLKDLRSNIPAVQMDFDMNSDERFVKLKQLLNKVNEMQVQRTQLYESLREAVIKDDITSQIVSLGDQEKQMEILFKKELSKYDQTVLLIDQNLTAQSNILKAMTDCYAMCAPTIKQIMDVKYKREQFFSSLIASYDVYEDLLGKSSKGLEFYKKLQTNIQKLYARVKAARDVQDEERQQRLKSSSISTNKSSTESINQGPKLKDYLIHKMNNSNLPSVRPNPLGSETPSAAVGVNTYDNQPPPTYMASLNYPTMNVDGTSGANQYGVIPGAGYTNPMYETISQLPPNYHQSMSTPVSEAPPNYNQQHWDKTIHSTANKLNQMNLNQKQIDQPVAATSAHAVPTSNTYNYDTTNYGNYQITANKQYVTRYDNQTTAYSNTTGVNDANNTYTAYSSHPGYSFNTNTGEYQYGSGYQADNNLSHNNFYQSHYTTAGSENSQQSSTNSQTTQGSGKLDGYQYLPNHQQVTQPAGVHQESGIFAPPISTSQNSKDPGSYYNIQYGYHSMNLQPDTMNYQYPNSATDMSAYMAQTAYAGYQMPAVTSISDSMLNQPHNQYYNNGQATYMNSNNNGGTSTTNSGSIFGQYDNTTTTTTTGQDQLNTDNTGYPQQNQFQPIQPQAITMSNKYQPEAQIVQPQFYTTPYQNDYQAANQYSNIQQQQVNQMQQPIIQQQVMQQPQLIIQQQQPILQQQQQPQITQNVPEVSPNTPQIQQQQLPPNVPSVVHQPIIPTQPSVEQQQPPAVVHQPPAMVQQPPAIQQQPPAIQQPPAEIAPIPQITATIPPTQPPPPVAVAPKPRAKSNIDLLSDIDFTFQPTGGYILKPSSLIDEPLDASSTILEPTPIAVSKPPAASSLNDILTKLDHKTSKPVDNLTQLILTTEYNTVKSSEHHMLDRKSSVDNLSVCSSELSSDYWDSASVKNNDIILSENNKPPVNPFDDQKTLKQFHKDVERLEKFIDTINVKTLNGTTQLDGKWKELQDLLVKDESKRMTNIAKLFPEKNRSVDCIPYDHSRVLLPTNTDDYINAAFIRELGPGCPQFIITQVPMQNTFEDFWCMIFSQKSRIIVSLHTSNELLDPYWPTELNKEATYGDYSVTLYQQFELSHSTENYIKLVKHNTDFILNLSLIQIKSWQKNSTTNILGISNNIITAYRQRVKELKQSTLITLNCTNGSDRSGIIATGIATILATQMKRPLLINVIDIWYRICSQRKGALRDMQNLQLSLQVVLAHGHDVLNKRGIMTSYQMKLANQTSKLIEKEEVSDPFSDLDPLWKLKN